MREKATMRFTKAQIKNFRNHDYTELEFGRGTNIFVGLNGQGKTNILEALSYLCLTKSFYASNDSVVLSWGKESFEVEGQTIADTGTESTLRVAYQAQPPEKAYSINKRRMEPFSSIIGRYPIVVLSPEHAPITFAGPAERRRFVDTLLSQSSHAYLENLLEYRRVLQQRNKVLLDTRLGRANPSELLEPWDVQLIAAGSYIVQRRREFVLQFQSYIVSAYHRLSSEEEPKIEYTPCFWIGDTRTEEELQQRFRAELAKRNDEELRIGNTLVGPHRDEFLFQINESDLRKYASQGQHKTFLLALKLGEFFYLKERRGETPAMLMDDVFSELDEQRSARVLEFIGDLGQTFITSTQPGVFDELLSLGDHNRRFYVTSGTVAYETV